MRMPTMLPSRPKLSDQPLFARGFAGHLRPQDLEGIFDPRNLLCAAKCASKAGYAACLARCLLDGQACDGGLSNCS